MALITCPECGREISDKAVSCLGCGFPVSEYEPSEKSEYEKLVDEIYLKYMNGDDGGARTHNQRAKAIQELRKRSKVTTKKATDDLWMRAFGKTHTQMRTEKKKQDKEEWKQLGDNFRNSCEAINNMTSKNPKIPHCPKCRSTQITYGGNRPSIGRALVGGAVAGGAGAAIGGLTGKKGYAVCLNCGKRWKI